MNEMYLFTYGSLILADSKIQVIPEKSAFLKGYKLIVEKNLLSKTNYHYLLLQKTGVETDIVSGYLAKADEALLNKLDIYEGTSYKRIMTTAFTRTLEEVGAFVYIKA